jgi:hypothetical protein
MHEVEETSKRDIVHRYSNIAGINPNKTTEKISSFLEREAMTCQERLSHAI